MIDMHAHFLPEIDDGAKNVADTFQMIQEAQEVGFTGLVSTSHYIKDTYFTTQYERSQILTALRHILEEKNSSITLYNGAEIYIDEDMLEGLENGIIPKINHSRYVLMEWPMRQKMLATGDLITQLLDHDLIPIIAHPERYEYVQNNINCLQEYLDKGVLFQSNYSSIIGGYGILAKKTVIKLLQNGMVHCLGTDCHRPNSVYKQMDKILKQLSKVISDKEIELLTTVNPMKILNNQSLD